MTLATAPKYCPWITLDHWDLDVGEAFEEPVRRILEEAVNNTLYDTPYMVSGVYLLLDTDGEVRVWMPGFLDEDAWSASLGTMVNEKIENLAASADGRAELRRLSGIFEQLAAKLAAAAR